MSKSILILFSTLILLSSCQSQINLSDTPIGLINNVSYKDSQYNNSNAGNGFLVNYKKETYAITAKHILMIAKTPTMKVIDFGDELEEWRMNSKNDTSKFVILDKLLNASRTDLLNWDSMTDDWLIFSIKENSTNHLPLQFRKKPLIVGEKLFIIGWSYKDEDGAQRVYEYKYAKMDNGLHEIIQVAGPTSLGGLSGSPVVDEDGQLVGLVSSGWEDEETKEKIVAATGVDKIVKFLSTLK
ncbi:MAG: serine protease [Saprospiraceae bacterium]